MGPLDLLDPDPTPRFGKAPAWNAYVELHNGVAAAAFPADFGPADRVRISQAHGVDLATAFRDERAALYQDVLADRLANGDLDAEDRRLLGHLADTLALSPRDLRPAHERAFGAAVSEAVADDCLSVEERLLLYKLQHLLGLDPRLADGAYGVLARGRLLTAVAEALCDGVLTPDEEAEIERVRADLSLELPDALRERLDAARDRYHLLQGRLPTADVPADLAEGEVGRFAGRATWATVDGRQFERALGERVARSGQTAGLRMPTRAIRGRTDVGELVLTDRRLLLRPAAGRPRAIRLDALRQILRFRNGTVLRTRDDNRIYVDPGAQGEAFYTILYWLLFGARGAGPD